MTGGASVTVVIPTRDRGVWLARAVRVALAQRDVDLHVIVVDDGSRDQSGVARAAGEDPRVTVLRQDQGAHGVAAARNRGLAAAETPLVAFLDDDDVWHPRWLTTAAAALRKRRAAFAYGSAATLTAQGDVCGWEPCPDPASVPEGLQRDNVVGSPSQVVLATDAVRDVGGWDPRFSVVADWVLWLRLRDRRCAAIEETLVGYTVHRGAMHLGDPDVVLSDFQRMWEPLGLAPPDERRYRRWMAMEFSRFGEPSVAARLYRELAVEERRPADLLRAVRNAVPYRPRLRQRFGLVPDLERMAWWPEAAELSRIARGATACAEPGGA